MRKNRNSRTAKPCRSIQFSLSVFFQFVIAIGSTPNCIKIAFKHQQLKSFECSLLNSNLILWLNIGYSRPPMRRQWVWYFAIAHCIHTMHRTVLCIRRSIRLSGLDQRKSHGIKESRKHLLGRYSSLRKKVQSGGGRTRYCLRASDTRAVWHPVGCFLRSQKLYITKRFSRAR